MIAAITNKCTVTGYIIQAIITILAILSVVTCFFVDVIIAI
ncbi:hypothetical protein SALWKB12_0875 [Snodgrassella communis]|uniref:Uncharacterized protein n=1 Tax=Snodgrassella communis TaxID=2946699 RepID=A0A837AG94_9NEIS|nr:hypothetical protein SALWKB12_0875 [Snodgrassella communis]KDN14006.1 hypothetical protein SALWKB29_1998 [Snodgrassella communis]